MQFGARFDNINTKLYTKSRSLDLP